MAWMMDDKIHSNAKVMALPGDPYKLWSIGLAWLRDNRPAGDYVIPHGAAEGLAAQHGIKAIRKAISELVARCFWHEVTGGYEVHDAQKWDPRFGKAEAGKEGANRRWQKDRSPIPQPKVTHDSANGTSIARAPEPFPDPEPKSLATQASTPKPPGGASSRLTEANRESLDAVVAIWNRHCTPLPTLRKPPANAAAVRLMLGIWDHFDGDADAIGSAIRRAARDPHYRENRYGIEQFARHLSRWDGGDTPAVPRGTGNPIDDFTVRLMGARA